jgi:FMN-dependent NADH-azoreductase
MAKLLHIQASPRGGQSTSLRVAEAFLAGYRKGHPGDAVETLDLFAADIPEFNAPAAAAKYQVMKGEAQDEPAARVWRRVIKVIDHFKTADKIVISSPMWNFGIPYRLKQYIDVIVQPGLTFAYSRDRGYQGLVTGKPAMLIVSRGGAYPPDSPMDMQKAYLEMILKFIGFDDIRSIVIEPTLAQGPQIGEERVQAAVAQAEQAAKTF